MPSAVWDLGPDGEAELGPLLDRLPRVDCSRVGLVDHDVEDGAPDRRARGGGADPAPLPRPRHILGNLVFVIEEDRHVVAGRLFHVNQRGRGDRVSLTVEDRGGRDAMKAHLSVRVEARLEHRSEDLERRLGNVLDERHGIASGASVLTGGWFASAVKYSSNFWAAKSQLKVLACFAPAAPRDLRRPFDL